MTPSPKKNEAILFSTTVSINNEGKLITRHNSLPLFIKLSNGHEIPLQEFLKKRSVGDYYTNLVCAIIRHCNSDSYYFDEQLDSLLKTF